MSERLPLGPEGVVAKKRSGHYLPGRRGWFKTKNRDYWRYPSRSTQRAEALRRGRMTLRGAAVLSQQPAWSNTPKRFWLNHFR
jgi:ATP-dependent DNA ligase